MGRSFPPRYGYGCKYLSQERTVDLPKTIGTDFNLTVPRIFNTPHLVQAGSQTLPSARQMSVINARHWRVKLQRQQYFPEG